MLKDSSCFVLVKGTQISLSLADGSSITASGIGTAIILSNDGQPIYPQNSLVIPSISVPLISLGPFLKKRFFLIGKGDVVELVSSNGETLLTGSLTDRVVCVKLVEPKANHISCRDDALAIHKALGHSSLQYATRMRPDVDFSSVNCQSWIPSKSHRLPFSSSIPLAKMPLECVHMDLCGPVSPLSRGKNRYILQIVDGYSHYRFSYMLSQKSLAFEAFKAFKAYAETQTNFRVGQVVIDNGGEFIGNNFKTLFANEGIECLLTAPHTLRKKPFAERANRTFLERTRCLLLDSKLDHSWWGEALSTELPLHQLVSRYHKGHKNYKVFNMVTVFTIPSVEVYTPVPVLTSAEVEDSGNFSSCGSSPSPSCSQSGHTYSESAADAAEGWSLEPTCSLPKGWVMENVPVVAPNNISSSIEISNILNSKKNSGRNVGMAASIPESYSQAISHEK
ncbi:hypothetical protein O181_036848 [Austropuccinia psidii MF-1]|uniref:Integrase catalytic domain-containing protein n=1 Tax=Austropuccinia psidii MF-1 TaxID=1389203 RepID=A0A9Q3D879_9BASI|nr:hypothetical protein [Austropuccinia psidii MF-1]